MSRTIQQQCRTLSKVIPSIPGFYYQRGCRSSSRNVFIETGSSKSCQSRRNVHTARAHSHHGHSKQSTTSEEVDHELINTKKLKDGLRLLLRDIAQPVAVVTSLMPTSGSADAGSTIARSTYTGSSLRGAPEDSEIPYDIKYHGATLSSFTSIAMDPYPLVAFALRIPSRMATTLASVASSLSSSSSSKPSKSDNLSSLSSHMVINLLSASQASTAITFSRPDLYPAPFESGAQSEKVHYSLSKDGLPILHGVVGALSCKLIGGPIPLHDLDFLGGMGTKAKEPVLGKGDVASELFIARVTWVEDVHHLRTSEVEDEEEWDPTLPLVYHRRSYTSCHPRPSRIKDKKV